MRYVILILITLPLLGFNSCSDITAPALIVPAHFDGDGNWIPEGRGTPGRGPGCESAEACGVWSGGTRGADEIEHEIWGEHCACVREAPYVQRTCWQDCRERWYTGEVICSTRCEEDPTLNCGPGLEWPGSAPCAAMYQPAGEYHRCSDPVTYNDITLPPEETWPFGWWPTCHPDDPETFYMAQIHGWEYCFNEVHYQYYDGGGG